MADGFSTVAKASDIPLGEFKPVEVGGRRLLVCHTDAGFFAVDDTCTHDDGPLADGFLDGNAIECPRHGARFDVASGTVLCLPAAVGIASYGVRVEGDSVQVNLALRHP